MNKNIVVFSDGTGQAGGVRPDQHLSNIYKLYRACRAGPDSPIDPPIKSLFTMRAWALKRMKAVSRYVQCGC